MEGLARWAFRFWGVWKSWAIDARSWDHVELEHPSNGQSLRPPVQKMLCWFFQKAAARVLGALWEEF
jgi:hypothetical protein